MRPPSWFCCVVTVRVHTGCGVGNALSAVITRDQDFGDNTSSHKRDLSSLFASLSQKNLSVAPPTLAMAFVHRPGFCNFLINLPSQYFATYRNVYIFNTNTPCLLSTWPLAECNEHYFLRIRFNSVHILTM